MDRLRVQNVVKFVKSFRSLTHTKNNNNNNNNRVGNQIQTLPIIKYSLPNRNNIVHSAYIVCMFVIKLKLNLYKLKAQISAYSCVDGVKTASRDTQASCHRRRFAV